MQLSIRQGIVRYETSQSPPLLSWTSMSDDSIDLNIIDSPCIVTFAHYTANYVIEETRSVVGAWGGGDINSANGPFPGTTIWLYWDIDLGTGAITRGWTDVEPIWTSGEPLSPSEDLHWYDLDTNRTRVWFPSATLPPGYWIDKVRVFAAKVNNGATIEMFDIGSQANITGSFQGGNLLLGVNNVPLKQQDGTFATTATQLIVQQTTGQNVQYDTAVIYGTATEEIPQNFLVTFLPYRRLALASSNNVDTFVNGISVSTLNQDEVGRVVTGGVVVSDQFDFAPEEINKVLFCTAFGEITLTPPAVGVLQQIGYVYSNDSIFLDIQQPVRLR